MDFLEKLLDYYGFSKQDYEKRVLAPSFSSLPLIDAKEETQKAIQALTDAKSQGEKVLVYGDYDTDGIMSASIMVRALREFGLTAEGYLPSRYKDGYGLTAENVDKIADKGFNLIFTTDNGVAAYEALDEAKKRGLKVIILDHHEFGEKAPEALAVLHPTTLAYGDTPISAGYLSFIFSCALLKKEDDYLLTLGAMSTLSDLMPLTSYNREIVRLALEAIQKNNYPEIGLLSDKRPIDETILQMEIIPKLNAVGRLLEGYETNRLLKYFSLVDPTGKEAVASWLNSVNEERKEKTKAAELSLSFDPNEEALVVLADIPEGLNGLLANRLLQEYEKPVAVFSPSKKDPNVLVGSIRSKEGFNVLKALEGTKTPLTKGGHAFAGGVSIKVEDFPTFKKDFLFAALKHKLTPQKEKLIPLTKEEATLENERILRSFGPFGQEWKAPAFELDDLDCVSFTYAANGKYLSTPFGKEARLFSFSLGEKAFSGLTSVSLKAHFQKNVYRGRVSLDLLAESLD
jgi:single-stranded-DNA-specific exonuclease